MDNTNFKKIYINRLIKIEYILIELMENKKCIEYCKLLREKERIIDYLKYKEESEKSM